MSFDIDDDAAESQVLEAVNIVPGTRAIRRNETAGSVPQAEELKQSIGQLGQETTAADLVRSKGQNSKLRVIKSNQLMEWISKLLHEQLAGREDVFTDAEKEKLLQQTQDELNRRMRREQELAGERDNARVVMEGLIERMSAAQASQGERDRLIEDMKAQVEEYSVFVQELQNDNDDLQDQLRDRVALLSSTIAEKERLRDTVREQMVRASALVERAIQLDQTCYQGQHQAADPLPEDAEPDALLYHDFEIGERVLDRLMQDLVGLEVVSSSAHLGDATPSEERSLPERIATVQALKQRAESEASAVRALQDERDELLDAQHDFETQLATLTADKQRLEDALRAQTAQTDALLARIVALDAACYQGAHLSASSGADHAVHDERRPQDVVTGQVVLERLEHDLGALRQRVTETIESGTAAAPVDLAGVNEQVATLQAQAAQHDDVARLRPALAGALIDLQGALMTLQDQVGQTVSAPDAFAPIPAPDSDPVSFVRTVVAVAQGVTAELEQGRRRVAEAMTEATTSQHDAQARAAALENRCVALQAECAERERALHEVQTQVASQEASLHETQRQLAAVTTAVAACGRATDAVQSGADDTAIAANDLPQVIAALEQTRVSLVQQVAAAQADQVAEHAARAQVEAHLAEVRRDHAEVTHRLAVATEQVAAGERRLAEYQAELDAQRALVQARDQALAAAVAAETALHAQVQADEAALAKQQADLAAATATITEQTATIATLQAAAAADAASFADLKTRIAARDQALAATAAVDVALREELQASEATVAAQQAELTAAAATISEQTAALAALQASAVADAAVRADLATQLAARDQALVVAAAVEADLRQRLQTGEASLAKQQAELSATAATIQEQAATMIGLQAAMAADAASLSDLKTRIAARDQALAAAAAVDVALREELQASDATVAAQQAELTAAAATISEQTTAIAALQASAVADAAMRADLATQLAARDQALVAAAAVEADLRQQLQTGEASLAKLQAELSAAAATIQEQAATMVGLQSAMAADAAALADMQARVAARDQALAAAAAVDVALREELQASEAMVAEQRAELTELRRCQAVMQAELSESRAACVAQSEQIRAGEDERATLTARLADVGAAHAALVARHDAECAAHGVATQRLAEAEARLADLMTAQQTLAQAIHETAAAVVVDDQHAPVAVMAAGAAVAASESPHDLVMAGRQALARLRARQDELDAQVATTTSQLDESRRLGASLVERLAVSESALAHATSTQAQQAQRIGELEQAYAREIEACQYNQALAQEHEAGLIERDRRLLDLQSELGQLVETHRHVVETVATQRQESQRRVQDLVSQVAASQAQTDAAQRLAEEDVQRLRVALTEAREQVYALEQQLEELNDRLATAVAEWAVQRDGYEARQAERDQQLAALQRELLAERASRAQADVRLAANTNDVGGLRLRLQQDLGAAQRRLTELEADNARLRQVEVGLQARVASLLAAND